MSRRAGHRVVHKRTYRPPAPSSESFESFIPGGATLSDPSPGHTAFVQGMEPIRDPDVRLSEMERLHAFRLRSGSRLARTPISARARVEVVAEASTLPEAVGESPPDESTSAQEVTMAKGGHGMNKHGASITAGAGPFAFGEHVALDALVEAWTPATGKGFDRYFARIDCTQDGEVVLSQVEGLAPLGGRGEWVFGPTPLYQGGAATGVLTLEGWNDGLFVPLATDTFDILG